MSEENFWPCLDTMVSILAGNREQSESTLNQLEAEVKALPRARRNELHNDMMIVVGQLARLATRIGEME